MIFNLEFRYDLLRLSADFTIFFFWLTVFVLIPFLPIFVHLFQRKSLVSESWKRVYECHRCSVLEIHGRFNGLSVIQIRHRDLT